jgi:hypothetical protein
MTGEGEVGLALSWRAHNALAGIGCTTVEELAALSPLAMMDIRGFGVGCLFEVRAELRRHGYVRSWFDVLDERDWKGLAAELRRALRRRPIVVSLDQRRGAASAHAACPCGSSWFELRRQPGDPEGVEHGAVCISAEGAVTGFVGLPHCISCGLPWRGPGSVRDA